MNNDDIAIKVEHINKTFHEQVGARSFKEAFVSIGKKITGKKTDKISKDFTALNDINFEVKKGEFFGIVGRNGSGKSTLLKLMAGVYTPTKGTISVNGNLTPFIELGVGFNPELSGRDNVFLNGALLGFSRKQMEKMYDEIVHFAELKGFMDVKLKNYSSGMQVRLAFSVAIRADSDILLIDEVLAVGDAAFQQKCFNYFEVLKQKKRTVIFVTHDMGSVRRFCDKALYLENGIVREIGSTSKIADIYITKNINAEEKSTSKEEKVPPTIDVKLMEQSKDDMTMEFKVHNEYDFEVYIGFSVIMNGMSIAELNNLYNDKSRKYKLNIENFNPGVYEISAALFKVENREMIGITETRQLFSIKGDDMRRGGALKLEDSWL